MKKVISILFLTIFLLMCSEIRQSSKVNLSMEEQSRDILLSFKSAGSKQAVNILGSPSDRLGSLFYQTENGIHWLRGMPGKIQKNDTSLIAHYSDQGKVVQLKVITRDDDFKVSLKATPDDDILKWGFNIQAQDDEYFTGLFERTVDGSQNESWKEGISEGMNLRGQSIDMLIKHTLSLYSPFYLSSAGYGLFVEGTWPGHYDMCKEVNNPIQIEFEGPSLDFHIYTSTEPAEIVKQHTLHVGPPILPPKWAFGHWRWRDNHDNLKTYYDGTPATSAYNSMLVEDVLMMDALDIPCGVYWIDRPWAKGFFGYEDFMWDEKRLPNALEMIHWLDQKNIRLLLWISPWTVGDMATEAKKRGFNLKPRSDDFIDTTKMALLDFTNEEARKWWQEQGLAKVLKQGIRGFKLDRSEEIVPQSQDIKVYDGRTTRETRNDYPVQYVRTAYEVCTKIHGDDFVLMPRAGYTGSSKYAVFWGGDIASPKEGLRSAIIALLRSSIIGYPLWGSDIGGYWGGDLDREVTARWLAFGCFSPIMEVGPTEDHGLWDMPTEPTYDTELLAIWRLYATLHTNLIDYTYRYAKEAHETGMPIARPLFLVYPDQKQAWEEWQTYLYGSDILVSAIWDKNKTTHECYLPAGEQWIDAWETDTIYKGGQRVKLETPLYKMPIFIRQCSNIDLGDLNQIYQESLEKVKNKPDLGLLEPSVKY